jgi:hypothetical protein
LVDSLFASQLGGVLVLEQLLIGGLLPV